MLQNIQTINVTKTFDIGVYTGFMTALYTFSASRATNPRDAPYAFLTPARFVRTKRNAHERKIDSCSANWCLVSSSVCPSLMCPKVPLISKREKKQLSPSLYLFFFTKFFLQKKFQFEVSFPILRRIFSKEAIWKITNKIAITIFVLFINMLFIYSKKVIIFNIQILFISFYFLTVHNFLHEN